MKIRSTTLGMIILLVLFGSIALVTSLGWWQTSGEGNRNRSRKENDGGGSHAIVTVHGTINPHEVSAMSITVDNGDIIQVKVGNSRYNQSIGFAPAIGERVSVTGFTEEQGSFHGITVTIESTGQVFTFRSETGQPLWSGGDGEGNGDNH